MQSHNLFLKAAKTQINPRIKESLCQCVKGLPPSPPAEQAWERKRKLKDSRGLSTSPTFSLSGPTSSGIPEWPSWLRGVRAGHCLPPRLLAHFHHSTWLRKADTIVAHIPSKSRCHLTVTHPYSRDAKRLEKRYL